MNPLLVQILLWLLGALGQLIVIFVRNLQNGGAASDALVNAVRTTVASVDAADLTGPQKRDAATETLREVLAGIGQPIPSTSQLNTLVELAVQELKKGGSA